MCLSLDIHHTAFQGVIETHTCVNQRNMFVFDNIYQLSICLYFPYFFFLLAHNSKVWPS